jgi:hypothetical protein
MTTRSVETSPMRWARIAGLWYLALLPAPFGLLYVPSRIIVSGNAAATAANVVANQTLFRLGIVTNLAMAILNIFLALALYQVLKPAGKNIARLMVIFVLVVAPISMLNELNNLAAIAVLNGANYLKVFSGEQLESMAYLFIRLHSQGIVIAQIFWGLWLFPMGYLVYKSGFLPRIIGVLLMIACCGYVADSLMSLILPTIRFNIIFFTSWGELVMMLWLLIKGVNVEQWNQRAVGVA